MFFSEKENATDWFALVNWNYACLFGYEKPGMIQN